MIMITAVDARLFTTLMAAPEAMQHLKLRTKTHDQRQLEVRTAEASKLTHRRSNDQQALETLTRCT